MSLEDEAAKVIDTSWHYSWHWERNHTGYLTLKGWETVLENAQSRLANVQGKIRDLENLIPKLEAEIAKRRKWEEEDLL